MLGLRTSNPRNWWRGIKELTGQKSRSSQPLSALANQLHDGDMSALASSVNSFFQQVAADLHPLSIDAPPPPDFSSEFDISRAAVEAKLRHINVYKAPGPDGLPNWVLRGFSAQLAGPVCAIFDASVREGFVPARWKEANVIVSFFLATVCIQIQLYAAILSKPLLFKNRNIGHFTKE